MPKSSEKICEIMILIFAKTHTLTIVKELIVIETFNKIKKIVDSLIRI